ncbi:MAG: nitroreductase family protein [Planctomycetia bacterium]|nr:nitroreductase family protein [Planctomycetia bacterium]
MNTCEISVSAERCVKCGQCVYVCPANIFSVVPESQEMLPVVSGEGACIQCGHCVAVCPGDAISHSSFRVEQEAKGFSVARSITSGESMISPLKEAESPSWEEFRKVVCSRRSVRVFQNKPVERENLAKIVECGQIAPSATNRRGTFWTVITNSVVLREIVQLTEEFLEKSCKKLHSLPAKIIASCCPESEVAVYRSKLSGMETLLKVSKKRDMVLHNAPALLIAHYDKKDGRFADPDAQLAIQNATLAAVALGLGTFYTGFVTRAADSDPRIAKAISVPSDHKIAGGMVVGYPAVKYRYAIYREYPSVMWIE